MTVSPLSAVIVPSATFIPATGWPSLAAARPTRISLTSAEACWTAGAQFGIDCDPAVTPSFGTSAVSPEMILSRSRSMPSSSAQTCAIAVTAPWPSSTLPIISVTVRSALMRSHALSIGLSFRSPGSFAASSAASPTSKGIAKERARNPAVCSSRRRFIAKGAFMIRSPVRRAIPRGQFGYASRSGRDYRRARCGFPTRWVSD